MKRKTLLTIALSLTLVLGACGTSAGTDAKHNTENIINTEIVGTIESVDSVIDSAKNTDTEYVIQDGTEIADETDDVESANSEKKTSDTEITDTENNSSDKTVVTNVTTTAKNDSTNKSDSSATNKPDSTINNKTDKTDSNNESDSTNTGNNSNTTQITTTPETCKHTNTFCSGANGQGYHEYICSDCLDNNVIVVVRTENCDFSSGECSKCYADCPHNDCTYQSDGVWDGYCSKKCNICGLQFSTGHHTTWWTGTGTECSYCHDFWPCDHSDECVSGINSGGAETHQISCVHCHTKLRIESCNFVNGSCTVCGQTEPCHHERPTGGGCNYNGTHKVVCFDCGAYLGDEACTYGDDGMCISCLWTNPNQ